MRNDKKSKENLQDLTGERKIKNVKFEKVTVELHTDSTKGKITVNGDTGGNVVVTGRSDEKHKNTTSSDTITLKRDVLPGEHITSTKGKVIVHGDIGKDAVVEGFFGVTAGSVGANAKVLSSSGKIVLTWIGKGAVIDGYGDVTARSVGDNAKVSSSSGKVYLESVWIGKGAVVEGYGDVTACSVGDNAKVSSSSGEVYLQGTIGKGAVVKGYADVSTRGGNVYDNAKVSSSHGCVGLGNLGNTVEVSGASVHVHTIGTDCRVNASSGYIIVYGNVGKNSCITGVEGEKVTITGTRHPSAKVVSKSKPFPKVNKSGSSRGNSSLSIFQSDPNRDEGKEPEKHNLELML